MKIYWKLFYKAYKHLHGGNEHRDLNSSHHVVWNFLFWREGGSKDLPKFIDVPFVFFCDAAPPLPSFLAQEVGQDMPGDTTV